ncbi:MAG: hypothetical protein ACREOJ_18475, partial [Gemmatimonadaceae bacterium]
MKTVRSLRRTPPEWYRDVKWGEAWGLWFAAVLSAFVVIKAFILGSPQDLGISLPAIVFFYFASGIVGGLLMAVLRPIATTMLGWTIAVIIVMLPIAM